MATEISILCEFTLLPRVLSVFKGKIEWVGNHYGQIWLNLNDVTKALNYKKPHLVVHNVFSSNTHFIKPFQDINTSDYIDWIPRYTMFLSELGLYYFIIHSSKPKARKLKKWISLYAKQLHLKTEEFVKLFDKYRIPNTSIEILTNEMEKLKLQLEKCKDEELEKEYKMREHFLDIINIKCEGELEFKKLYPKLVLNPCLKLFNKYD